MYFFNGADGKCKSTNKGNALPSAQKMPPLLHHTYSTYTLRLESEVRKS
jgi:hypothetical protein